MKYEVPVCEMLEFSIDDVITTSAPTAEEVPVYGDTGYVGTQGSISDDGGAGGSAE